MQPRETNMSQKRVISSTKNTICDFYVKKEQLPLLAEHSVGRDLLQELLEENRQLQDQIAELKEQVIRDPLTNAFNRRYFLETLEREAPRAERNELPLSLVMIDIDHFKKINDAFGHQAGDFVLRQLVKLLTERIRKGDVLCRYGGEEFVILMPQSSLEDTQIRAEEWRMACEEMQIAYEGTSLQITISLGVASKKDMNTNAQQLLKRADRALYKAKVFGRNCTAVFQQRDTRKHIAEKTFTHSKPETSTSKLFQHLFLNQNSLIYS